MAKARAVVGGELSGRVGGLVYVQGPNGTVVRDVPRSRGATTRARIMVGERMALAAGVWQRMEPAAMARWRTYAESLAATEPALSRAPARGYLAFSALATRIMQIELGATVPTEPPTGFFAGDGVRVVASGSGSPSPSGSSWRGGRGERDREAWEIASTPSLPSPKGEDAVTPSPNGEAPGILFLADRANGVGIVTELLSQPLANAGRTPVGSKYRSRAFVAFAEGGLEAAVALPAGWHACAVRFVERATGRATGLFPCGIVRVAA